MRLIRSLSVANQLQIAVGIASVLVVITRVFQSEFTQVKEGGRRTDGPIKNRSSCHRNRVFYAFTQRIAMCPTTPTLAALIRFGRFTPHKVHWRGSYMLLHHGDVDEASM